MTGHAKLRILHGAGLVLAALCVVVALRVVRTTKKPPTPTEQVTYVAHPVEIRQVVTAIPSHRARAATSSVHLEPQPDTGKQHKKVVVERIITDEDFKRLPLSPGYDRHWGYNGPAWGPHVFALDLSRYGSLERALDRVPGVVVRPTDPP
jgi:hypothetical protein